MTSRRMSSNNRSVSISPLAKDNPHLYDNNHHQQHQYYQSKTSSSSSSPKRSSLRSASQPPPTTSISSSFKVSSSRTSRTPPPPPSSSLSSSSKRDLFEQTKIICHKMSYVLISTDDFHRGPTRISTIDPYLHEKVPFTVIKDSLYFQAEPQYDPHGRYWKFRVEDAPVRVLNKLLDLGYKVLTGTSLSGSYEHKQPGHAWTLFRDPNIRSTTLMNHYQNNNH